MHVQVNYMTVHVSHMNIVIVFPHFNDQYLQIYVHVCLRGGSTWEDVIVHSCDDAMLRCKQAYVLVYSSGVLHSHQPQHKRQS